jgi:hypothetical protein
MQEGFLMEMLSIVSDTIDSIYALTDVFEKILTMLLLISAGVFGVNKIKQPKIAKTDEELLSTYNKVFKPLSMLFFVNDNMINTFNLFEIRNIFIENYEVIPSPLRTYYKKVFVDKNNYKANEIQIFQRGVEYYFNKVSKQLNLPYSKMIVFKGIWFLRTHKENLLYCILISIIGGFFLTAAMLAIIIYETATQTSLGNVFEFIGLLLAAWLLFSLMVLTVLALILFLHFVNTIPEDDNM